MLAQPYTGCNVHPGAASNFMLCAQRKWWVISLCALMRNLFEGQPCCLQAVKCIFGITHPRHWDRVTSKNNTFLANSPRNQHVMKLCYTYNSSVILITTHSLPARQRNNTYNNALLYYSNTTKNNSCLFNHW